MTDFNPAFAALATQNPSSDEGTQSALELLEQEEPTLADGEKAKLKPSFSERLGDWAQALAATYAARPQPKEQGCIHRV